MNTSGQNGRSITPRSMARRSMASQSMAGQSIIEYLIVLMLFVLALSAGPHSPLERLFDAFGDRYERFTHAMSMP